MILGEDTPIRWGEREPEGILATISCYLVCRDLEPAAEVREETEIPFLKSYGLDSSDPSSNRQYCESCGGFGAVLPQTRLHMQ